MTLTSDASYGTLVVATGSTFYTKDFNVTVAGSATGGVLIYGYLDARSGSGTYSTITVDGAFETSGTGSFRGGTGSTLVLTGSGGVAERKVLTVSGSTFNTYIDNGLLGYWKFDTGTGTIAFDSSRYGNRGTLTGMDPSSDWVIPSNSSIRFTNLYALDFDGTNDEVLITNLLNTDGTDPFTFALWGKTSSSTTNMRMMSEEDTNVSPDGISWQIDAGEARFLIRSGNTVGNDIDVQTTSSYNNGAWRHFVVTYDGTDANGVEIYVDGVNQAVTINTNNLTGDPSVTESFNIGGVNGGGSHFAGTLDDVRVYNRILAPSEVADLAAGLLSSGSGTYTLGSALDVNGEFAMFSGGLNNSAAHNITVAGSWRNVAGRFVTGGETVIFDGEGGMIKEEDIFSNIRLDDGLIGYWKLDDGTGSTIARDSSIYGNNGTLTGGPIWTAQSSTGTNFYNPYALSFDGSNDYVSIGDVSVLDDAGEMSISAWVYNDNLTANASVVGKWGTTPSQSFLLYMDTDGGADGYRFIVRDTGDTSRATSDADANATASTWQHVVGTYNTNNINVYVDGVLESTAAGGSGIKNITDALGIGSDTGDSSVRPFNGVIDDVRIYNRALTATEVKALANGYQDAKTSDLMGHWKFDEGTGTTTADSSVWGNDGTTSGTPTWVASSLVKYRNPYFLDFDGTDDYVSISHTDYTSLSEGAVSLWARTAQASRGAYVTFGGNGGAGNDAWLLTNESDGTIRLIIREAASNDVALTTASAYNNNRWRHITVQNDGTKVSMFVDGEDVTPATTNGNLWISHVSTINRFYIGASLRAIGGEYFDGSIDDVRVYARALKAWEIETLARGEQLEDGQYTLSQSTEVAGDISIFSSTLNAGSGYTLTLSGSWRNVGGFEHGDGSVVMDGTGSEHMTGSTIFNNMTNTTATTLTLDADGRQSFSGALVWDGFTLISSRTGSAASIIVDGQATAESVSNIAVRDNDATGGQEITCTTGCTDNSNNTNWTFGGAPAAGRRILIISWNFLKSLFS